jgi:hypothetical protein
VTVTSPLTVARSDGGSTFLAGSRPSDVYVHGLPVAAGSFALSEEPPPQPARANTATREIGAERADEGRFGMRPMVGEGTQEFRPRAATDHAHRLPDWSTCRVSARLTALQT